MVCSTCRLLSSSTPRQQTTLHLANSYGKRNEIKTERRTDAGGLFGKDTETFDLDLLANRITHSHTGSGAWQYDQSHRLLRRPGTNGGTIGDTVLYADGSNGNHTQKIEGTHTTHPGSRSRRKPG